MAVEMKRSKKVWRGLGLIGASLLVLGLANVFAILPATAPELANFDKRDTAARFASPLASQTAALAQLKSRLPGVRVDFDRLLSTPQWIASTRGFLSGPGGTGGAVSPQTFSRFAANDPDRPTQAFIAEHQGIFGHGPEALSDALVKRQFTTAHNGLRTIIWQQQVDNIPVFEALLISHTTTNGELVNISSHFLPEPAQAASAGTPNRASLQANPSVTAAQAVADAGQNIGEILATNQISPLEPPASAPDLHQRFKAAPLKGDTDAHLVWLPMSRTALRLCWEIILMSRTRGEMFQILIDARTGEALLRRGLTENLTDASYRVFSTDSPTPLSPGHASPVTNQPPQVPRVLIVTNAFNTNASPNGWINDGDNETTGNNVDAHLDRNADNLPDTPRPRGAPFRVFDPQLDLTQDPLSYGDAAVVNLFFWSNWMHDKLYEFGFTEAAGNFQANNFGRGGAGNDPVQTDAQDGSGFNNANFSTPPDGLSARMQMYIFNGPTPNRDGDLDTQVILHEYTHGLSNRRVGGGVGMSALQSKGLGEGWSDFYSLALLSKPGDDVNAIYPEASYASYGLLGLGQNYYYGIRRYPYTTDLTRNPETLKDIDPGQAGAHPGISRNPVIPNSATEIHNQGEIWCVTLWDVRANLINKYGFAAGNHLILQLLTDGMNLTPANPNFLQARDGVIQADLVDTGGANFHELWQAFAKRGMGDDAVVPPSSTTSGVIESFQVPDDLLVSPNSDFNASGTISGPFNPAAQTYKLCNTGTNLMNWSADATVAWVGFSDTSGTLAAGANTNILVSINAAANNLSIGDYFGAITFSNITSGMAESRNVTLSISPPRIFKFSLDNDPGWSREGQWAFGHPTGQGAVSHGNPDPTTGATGSNVFGVNLNGDYYSTGAGGPFYLTLGPLNFSNAANVVLQFQRWLNSDYQPFAFATVDVSNDGTNWAALYANGGTEVVDASWTEYQYDVSGFVDGQPAVYVRWGYQLAAGAFPYSGWNIDDIEFLGMTRLQVILPASATEGDGVLAGHGHLRVDHPPVADVTIALESSDPSEVTGPLSVTLLAGQTNTDFNLTIGDNLLLDGTRSATITASAAGYVAGSNSITVFDNETATLTVTLPASASEGDVPVDALVSASAAPVVDILIGLFSSDTNGVQVPAMVLLPAGQTSVGFSISFPDDQKINGDRSVTVTAQVHNWTNGLGTIILHDNENTNLNLTMPAQARQSNGVLTNAGRLHISGTLSTNLPISLATTNTSNLVLPSGVTILAGQTSAVFNITLVDTGQAYGTFPVLVSASATGFTVGQATITLTDDQTPPAPFNPTPPHLSTNNPTTVHLSWSPGLGEGVELLVNGDFESGALSNWRMTPVDGGFVIDDGMNAPLSGAPAVAPFAGGYSTICSQAPPGASLLYQDLGLPTNAGTIALSWVDESENFAADFSTNQQFRVEIRDTNDVTLAVVFSTQPGTPLVGDWTQRNADLSAYRGQIIRLAFIVEANADFLDVRLDNISIRATSLPSITYDVYFGTNSIPGPAEFLGSTTNYSWSLPGLTSFTAYYWQVVARRVNQTAGPIWQFSAMPTLSITDVTVVEGNSGTTNALFKVQLAGANDHLVSVDFTTVDGSAVAPDDYASTNGTLVFNPGETNKTIAVSINGDTVNEPNEVFSLRLSNPIDAIFITNQATGTILNDDNSPPSLAPIPDQNIAELTTLSLTSSASDPDLPNETLTFTLDPGAPSGASIDPVSGIFTWTPTEAQGPGTYTIAVRVTDGSSPTLSDSRTFSVSVNEVNSPPVLSAIPDRSVHAGSTVSFTAGATDPDLPTNGLAFALDAGAPTSASINPGTGVFTWTTGEADIGGTNSITIRVTDAGLPPLSDARAFMVTVVSRPQLVAISLSGGQILLGWSAIAGQVYRVEYKTDLNAAWNNLAGDVTASGPVATKLDAVALGQRRFYRVLVLP
jgi:hypothetical protein